jgi:hypothetical protein
VPIRRFRAGFCQGQNSVYNRAELGLKGGADAGIEKLSFLLRGDQILAVAMQKRKIENSGQRLRDIATLTVA